MSYPKSLSLFATIIFLVLLLSGCSSMQYYAQSITGHLGLMVQREPIKDLLSSETLDDSTRERLEQALSIRQYASEHLGLPDNDSYSSYVALEEKYVIWSVVATEKYSLKPLESCFPIVGCVTYRGYYNEEDANTYAESLRGEGYDVFVGGVQAYSTLGWFDDPVVSSMLDRGDILFAEVVFHELAHQVLYVDDDTPFNEAFASVVGEFGVRQWLKDTNARALPKYENWLAKKTGFVALLQGTAEELKQAYSVKKGDVAHDKQRIIEQLKERYEALKVSWGGFDGYDPWFDKPVNNARFASVAVYRDLIPDFSARLERCGGSIPRFMDDMSTMDGLGVSKRRILLKDDTECRGEASL